MNNKRLIFTEYYTTCCPFENGDDIKTACNHYGYGGGGPYLWVLVNETKVTSALDLCRVHKEISDEDVLSGKVFVIRDEIHLCKSIRRMKYRYTRYSSEVRNNITTEETADVWSFENEPEIKDWPFKTIKVKEGRLLVIGRTNSGNYKVKLFTK